MELNKYSKTITQDSTQPAAQAMLFGIGLTDEDMRKAQVGIVSMGYDGNTCNMHLNDLAKIVKQGVWDNDLVGLIFNTIGVSDGISNGTEGMRYSLVSRDIIADSIEAVCGAQYYDALIALPGCDKNMPGSLIAMAFMVRGIGYSALARGADGPHAISQHHLTTLLATKKLQPQRVARFVKYLNENTRRFDSAAPAASPASAAA